MKTETQLNDRQKLILVGVLRDIRRILHAAVNTRDVNSSVEDEGTPVAQRGRRERELRRLRAAREGLAVVNLWRWLQRTPRASDRVLVHRELLRLEAMGLLKRQAGRSGRRTSHVKLTVPGQRIARRLLADQDAIDAEDALAFDDFQLPPLEWPMEPQAEPGEAASLSPKIPPAASHATKPITPEQERNLT